MSHLEETFALAWRAYGTRRARMVREYRFHPTRKWRMDFAFPARRVAVEIEGAVYSRGRHTRGSGFVADTTKYNTAAALGWLVLRIPGPALDDPAAVCALVREALRGRRHGGLRAELRTRHRETMAREIGHGRRVLGRLRDGRPSGVRAGRADGGAARRVGRAGRGVNERVA